MAQDNTITTDTVIAMRSLLQTYETMDFHIKTALPLFKKLFPNAEVEKQEKIKSLREHDRIARRTRHVLQDKSKYTELLFCIHFEEVKLQTQIWINSNHSQRELVLEKARAFKENGKSFKTWEDKNGLGIYFDKKLYHFIGDKNADEEIKKWFDESFKYMRAFIDATPELKWDKSVMK